MKVIVSDVLGNKKKKYVGFSWLYMFFGPFYLLCRGKVLSFLLLAIMYYYFLPIPGMQYLADLINKINFIQPNAFVYINKLLLLFRRSWSQPYNYIGIITVVLIHFAIAFNCEGIMLKKYMRKKMLFPLTEEDARKLIYYKSAKFDVKLAPQNGVQTLYGYKSAEQLWAEKNMLESRSTYSNNPVMHTLSSLPKDEKIKRREHYNQLLKDKVITLDEYKILIERLNM